jgi:beta-galactosidase
MTGLKNSDLYFCEIQKTDASQYGMSGSFVTEGDVLLNACNTDWRKWNKRAEELKTAAILRSENEAKGTAPAFVKYQKGSSAFYISTLTEFANSEKGFNVLAHILKQAGIPHEKPEVNTADLFFLRDGVLQFPASIKDRFEQDGNGHSATMWVFSPRPLDDLLIEPNMPKLTLFVECWSSTLLINDKNYDAAEKTNRNATYKELPLHQGWNKLTLKIGQDDKGRFNASFKCDNKPDFLPLLKVTFKKPEVE